MRRSLLLAAIAATSMLAAQIARAEVYAYKCDGQTVQLDDAAGTITWDGNVFSNAHVVDGCRFNYRPPDHAGSTDYRAADQAG